MAADYDIVVAGGGLVGAAFAAHLAQQPQAEKLRIAVVEAKPFAAPSGNELFDPRVVALTEQSRRLLAGIGVWEQSIAVKACPYHHMVVRDSEGTGQVGFDCNDVHQANLGHIVENSIIQGALHGAIESQPNITFVYKGIEGVGRSGANHPVLRLAGGENLEATLVVAADGANSRVREGFDFPLRSWDYGHSAIVATIRTEQSHGFTARQWFMPTGPLAFLPLLGGDGETHYSSIVWSQNHDEAEALKALDNAAFCQALTTASEGSLGVVESISQRFMFPLRQRHASHYIKPGVALVGDAAHTIHPLAGQGVNLGFADVAALSEEICRGLDRGLGLDEFSMLQRYQRQRKAQNLAMMAAMEGFKRLFAEPLPLVRMLRNDGMNKLDGLLPVKKQLIRQAMGF